VLPFDETSTGAIDGDCLSPALRLAWRWANEERVSPWDRRSRAAVRALLLHQLGCGEGQPVAPVPHVSSSRPSAGTARREVDLDVERREAGAAAGGGLCTAAAAADFASRFQKSMVSSLTPGSVLTLSE
jgi:hypothetical protein